MVSVNTKISVTDNSGAKTGYCIKVLGSNPKKKGSVGDVLIVVIDKVKKKKTKSKKKVIPHQIRKAILLSTVKRIEKKNGLFLNFYNNNVVLIDDRNSPIGNRINQYTISNLRFRHYMKIVSLSFGIL